MQRCLQQFGQTPVRNRSRIKRATGWASSLQHIFKIRTGSPSGPVALSLRSALGTLHTLRQRMGRNNTQPCSTGPAKGRELATASGNEALEAKVSEKSSAFAAWSVIHSPSCESRRAGIQVAVSLRRLKDWGHFPHRF